MRKIIGTYFYEDQSDLGAEYGNLFCGLHERNTIYWNTVVCFFETCKICNRNNDIEYALFTNVSNFSEREKLESLGVVVHHNIDLSFRGNKKWATVKYFFNVIDYIVNSNYFTSEDLIVLVDTDVLCISDLDAVFAQIEEANKPVIYELGDLELTDSLHDMSISRLTEMYKYISSEQVGRFRKVGGEFFGFTKISIKPFLKDFYLLASEHEISTEEQILSIIHSANNFICEKMVIKRLWTTFSYYNVPSNFLEYSLLHLPAEKSRGFILLRNFFKTNAGYELSHLEYLKFLKFHFHLGNKILMRIRLLFFYYLPKLHRFVKFK